MGSSILNKRLLIGGVLAAALLVGLIAYVALSTWGEVNRVTIDRPASENSGGVVAQPNEEPDDEGETFEPVEVPGRQVILLVGSDSREDLKSTEGFGDFEGNRADVVMVLIKDDQKAGLLSLPRDLLVENPCSDEQGRLSAMLEGCEEMNGPSLLTVTVERVIGTQVDHFALVDLAGFQDAVDAVGGYEICLERPVRDERARLALPAGCTHASGEETLAWMRSRRTQELTENGWRTVPGVNDLVRNERQRAFLIDMMGRFADVTSPQAMAAAGQALAPFVTVDSEFTLMSAVSIAWTMRGLDSGAVTELDVPVHDATLENGAAVLVPARPVDEIVAEFLSTAAADGGVVLGLSGQ